jgi:hypothetical protein
MTARLTFVGLAVFWLTMNVLLWRVEFGSHGGETPVPVMLVCHKILTAPDSSSLTIFQDGERVGYCELSTSIGREMAAVDADKVPPEGLAKHAGYQVHVAGNMALNGLTNRLKFNGYLRFSNSRQWSELELKISLRQAVIQIHSLATNQTVHFKMTSEGAGFERDIAFSDFKNPGSLLRVFAGNVPEALFEMMDSLDLDAVHATPALEWSASRTRVKIGNETVPVYRLETSVLGRRVMVDVSTLGEILRVDLPGNITARIDEWSRS